MHKKAEVKHPKTAWTIVAIFVIMLGLWLFASYNYPHTLYEYHQTGEVVEYFDRAAGLEVETVPIFVPDNPLWVDIIRRIAPFSLFALFLAILYFAIEDRRPTEYAC